MEDYAAQQKIDKNKETLATITQDTKTAIDLITEAYSQALDIRIEQDQKALEKQQENVDLQEQRAMDGLTNTLAEEKAIRAEKEKQLLIDQKKQQKLKEIETFFNLMAAYAEKAPNTAAAKAFLQVQISKGIAARLEHGGVVSLVIKSPLGIICQLGTGLSCIACFRFFISFNKGFKFGVRI